MFKLFNNKDMAIIPLDITLQILVCEKLRY